MITQYTTRLEKIEEILSIKLPLKLDSEWIFEIFGKLPYATNESYIRPLIMPCRELVKLGGKRWRPLLLVLCAEMLFDKELLLDDIAYRLVPIVELIHTASLIHDDIEDSADLRRGKPAAYITYGVDTAINSGSWLYFMASSCIDNLNVDNKLKFKLYSQTTQKIRQLHLGQAMDIAWHREKNFFPSVDEYKSMVSLKTGTLASLASTLGAISAMGNKDDIEFLDQFAISIGVAFQILDDVINITTGNVGKKRGDDIVEGKKSLPILLHIQKYPNDKKFISDCFEDASKVGIDSVAVENCILKITKSLAVKEAFDFSKKMVLDSNASLLRRYDNDFAELIANLFMEMFSKQELLLKSVL